MNIKLTDKELELINNYCICQKDNPCNTCPTEQRWSCCGCPPEKEFKSKNKNTLDAYSELLESAPDFVKDITDKLTIFNIYYNEFVRTYKQFFSYVDEIKSDNTLWNFLINFYDLPIT